MPRVVIALDLGSPRPRVLGYMLADVGVICDFGVYVNLLDSLVLLIVVMVVVGCWLLGMIA